MRRALFCGILGLLLASATGWGGQGEEMFTALRCGSCHKPETGKTNPSLKQIAQAYQGKKDLLMKYLEGESEPIIKPEKAGMMKRYIEKTKVLSDKERKALADFIVPDGQ